jgi:hypothetical protein
MCLYSTAVNFPALPCSLLQIAMEFGTTSRLAQSTAAAVQFGVDPQDALDKISKLQERLSTLEQVRGSCCWLSVVTCIASVVLLLLAMYRRIVREVRAAAVHAVSYIVLKLHGWF